MRQKTFIKYYVSPIITPTIEFIVCEKYYCQWEHGAKEYFETMDDAIEYAESKFERTPKMTDENFKYWLTQIYLIGKEVVITQQTQIITSKMEPGMG